MSDIYQRSTHLRYRYGLGLRLQCDGGDFALLIYDNATEWSTSIQSDVSIPRSGICKSVQQVQCSVGLAYVSAADAAPTAWPLATGVSTGVFL
jgi:hypothetical protein